MLSEGAPSFFSTRERGGERGEKVDLLSSWKKKKKHTSAPSTEKHGGVAYHREERCNSCTRRGNLSYKSSDTGCFRFRLKKKKGVPEEREGILPFPKSVMCGHRFFRRKEGERLPEALRKGVLPLIVGKAGKV